MTIENDKINELLLEWKSRLGLNDWAIELILDDVILENKCSGECSLNFMRKCATITIAKNMPQNLICKEIHEKTLIHELLHLKFINPNSSDVNIEEWTYDIIQHQLLEDMAKALYMAKYGITDLQYFKN
ncbi:MAG: hypothetical protein RSA49_00145 [Anaerovoracaceae bacterium]